MPCKKRISLDDRGALEGMPLQLIIMVVIAGIAISIVITWLTIFTAPDLAKVELYSAEPETEPMKITENTTSITIKAWDTKGNPLEGVSIKMSGANVLVAGTSGPDGTFTASSLIIDIGTSDFGTIRVEAEYSGTVSITKTINIVVTKR
ncbi:MAG: hypothetical protein E3J35_01430 [Methanomassiliicoccales archaeon]|nr:MAG: hypothetical protein E3J35_01430 [Methanomassiliicoccales archaeon]